VAWRTRFASIPPAMSPIFGIRCCWSTGELRFILVLSWWAASFAAAVASVLGARIVLRLRLSYWACRACEFLEGEGREVGTYLEFLVLFVFFAGVVREVACFAAFDFEVSLDACLENSRFLEVINEMGSIPVSLLLSKVSSLLAMRVHGQISNDVSCEISRTHPLGRRCRVAFVGVRFAR
jgi:hypothetical protein